MKIYAVMFLLFSGYNAFAQSADLQFIPVTNNGNHFDVMVQIRGEEEFQLGSSNIKFNFNNLYLFSPVLLNPVNFSGGSYDSMTVTEPSPGIVSINVELLLPENGSVVITEWTNIAKVRFTIQNPSDTLLLSFRNMKPPETQNPTVIYMDNETDQVSEGTFYSLNSTLLSVEKPQLPKDFNLSQNYPNPFNPTTKINFRVPIETNVNIKLYSITGREVEEILNKKEQPGYYSINLNAGNLSSGVYIYRIITSSGYTSVKKMILLK